MLSFHHIQLPITSPPITHHTHLIKSTFTPQITRNSNFFSIYWFIVLTSRSEQLEWFTGSWGKTLIRRWTKEPTRRIVSDQGMNHSGRRMRVECIPITRCKISTRIFSWTKKSEEIIEQAHDKAFKNEVIFWEFQKKHSTYLTNSLAEDTYLLCTFIYVEYYAKVHGMDLYCQNVEADQEKVDLGFTRGCSRSRTSCYVLTGQRSLFNSDISIA